MWFLRKVSGQCGRWWRPFCSAAQAGGVTGVGVSEIPYLEYIVGLDPNCCYTTTVPSGCTLSEVRGDDRPQPGYDARLIRLRIENAVSLGARESILEEKSYMRDFPKFWLPLLADVIGGDYHRYSEDVFNWMTSNPMMMRVARKEDLERLYSIMISYAGVMERMKLARLWFDDMERKGIKKSTLSLNALIIAYAKKGEWQTSLALLDSMKAYRRECKPNALTYYILIAMYVRMNDRLSVVQMVKDCEAARFNLDFLTYNTLLHFYGRSGRLDDFESTYTEMQRKCKRKNAVRYVLEQGTYTALLLGYSRLNHLDKLEEILTEMQDERIYLETQKLAEEIAKACSRNGWAGGLRKLVRAVEASSAIVSTQAFQSYVLEAYVKAGELGDAEVYVESICDMRRAFVAPSAFEALVSALSEGKASERMYSLYEKIRMADFRPSPSSYELLVSQLAGAECYDRLEQVGLDMEEPGMKWPAQTLRVLLQAYEKSGNSLKIAEVSKRLKEAEESEVTMASYNDSVTQSFQCNV